LRDLNVSLCRASSIHRSRISSAVAVINFVEGEMYNPVAHHLRPVASWLQQLALQGGRRMAAELNAALWDPLDAMITGRNGT